MDEEEFGDLTFNFNENKAVDPQSLTKRRTFELSEAMLNNKQFSQVKDDYKKVKKIVVDMNIQLKRLEQFAKSELLTEEKYRISNELFENQVVEDIRFQTCKMKDILMPKIKRRIKFKNIKDNFAEKVSIVDFKAEIAQLNDKIYSLSDKFEYVLPTMEHELKLKIASKIDHDTFNHAVGKSVNEEDIDEIKRILQEHSDKIEELAKPVVTESVPHEEISSYQNIPEKKEASPQK